MRNKVLIIMNDVITSIKVDGIQMYTSEVEYIHSLDKVPYLRLTLVNPIVEIIEPGDD